MNHYHCQMFFFVNFSAFISIYRYIYIIYINIEVQFFPVFNIYCALLYCIKHCSTEKLKHRFPISAVQRVRMFLVVGSLQSKSIRRVVGTATRLFIPRDVVNSTQYLHNKLSLGLKITLDLCHTCFNTALCQTLHSTSCRTPIIRPLPTRDLCHTSINMYRRTHLITTQLSLLLSLSLHLH